MHFSHIPTSIYHNIQIDPYIHISAFSHVRYACVFVDTKEDFWKLCTMCDSDRVNVQTHTRGQHATNLPFSRGSANMLFWKRKRCPVYISKQSRDQSFSF